MQIPAQTTEPGLLTWIEVNKVNLWNIIAIFYLIKVVFDAEEQGIRPGAPRDYFMDLITLIIILITKIIDSMMLFLPIILW